MLREFTDEIINAVEDHRVSKFTTACREAGLPEPVVKRVNQDSHYHAGSKRALQVATPRVACKWLNKAGISAEYADEVALVTALGSVFIQGRKLQNTLEELLVEFKKRKEENERKNGTQNSGQTTAGPGGQPGQGPEQVAPTKRAV